MSESQLVFRIEQHLSAADFTAKANLKMDFFVRARSISDWSESRDAQAMLPHVVRRLVCATASGISELEFHAYESVSRKGFDGIVECVTGNAWVPSGRSVWELSTEKDKKGQFSVRKAENDFEKRTAETARDEQERSCFVCLTSRRFSQKRDWTREAAKRKDSYWREVRAFDADDLEAWIEEAPPGIAAWFGRLIGARPHGVDDVAQHWDAISNIGQHRLRPSVFLAGREQSVERVRQWLGANPNCLAMECRSPVDVIDFFCATIAAMDEAERIATESRAVVVHEMNAWYELRDATVPATLVADPSLPLPSEELGRAVRNGHHVLVAAEPTIFAGQPDSKLERASQSELSKSLEESGYAPAKAAQLARAAGGSLSILKHRLTPSGSRHVPKWAPEISSEVITACLLLGGWSSNESDQLAFGEIAGREYADCEPELQSLATSFEPLLLHAAGNWRLISKDHAWSLFEDRIASSALKRFEPLAVEILADDDPRYQLPEDERCYAHLRGHVAKYSETIKRHVSETLAFLGEFGARLAAASSIEITASVDRIVATVLNPTCTWHRWASLGSRLPLLAEASPSRFLRAVSEDLGRTTPDLTTLLNEEEQSPIFGRCNHAGLLWALEGLAWAKEDLGEVAELLLKLSALDPPESQWANRPKNSLAEILSYWMPHTTASLDERIQVLDLLINRDRQAAWPILVSLLPEMHGEVSTPTHQPYWRNWADGWVRGVTRGESLRFITATAERVTRQAGIDSERWRTVFSVIGRFPYTVRERFVDAANAFSQSDIPDLERRQLSEELSKQIYRHRHFEDANWSLPPEMLDKLERILERVQPHSCVLRNAWLFEQWPDRYFEWGGDHDDNQAALDEARQNAIREILDAEGFAGIESLVAQAGSPNDVGRALAMTTGDQFLRNVITLRLEGAQRDLEFAGGFIWNRFWPANWQWIDDSLKLCQTDNARARLLEALRFSPDVWRRAAHAGGAVPDLYWDRCTAFNSDLNSEDVTTAVDTLCRHQRPTAAINLLSMALHQKRELKPDTLFLPLETLLSLPADRADAKRARIGYHIQQIIGELQKRHDVDESRLIPVEWHFIRLLDEESQCSAQTLHRHLSTSPEFFIQILSFCFRSKKGCESDERSEPTVDERYFAEHSFHLLHVWDSVPGTQDDGTIDEQALRQWCISARQLATESGRLEVCDVAIGEVFAKSKQTDNDGSWPCQAIRRVAEEIHTDSLGSGMSCGIHNLRGAGFRAHGGDQERELATEFRQRANRIRFNSPFVARVLESVVQSYEGEAKWWDERDRWEE